MRIIYAANVIGMAVVKCDSIVVSARLFGEEFRLTRDTRRKYDIARFLRSPKREIYSRNFALPPRRGRLATIISFRRRKNFYSLYKFDASER